MKSSKLFLAIVAVFAFLVLILSIANAIHYNRERNVPPATATTNIRSEATMFFWLNVIWAFFALGILIAAIYFALRKNKPKIAAVTAVAAAPAVVTEATTTMRQNVTPLYELAGPNIVYQTLR